jgi:hypothetical protein
MKGCMNSYACLASLYPLLAQHPEPFIRVGPVFAVGSATALLDMLQARNDLFVLRQVSHTYQPDKLQRPDMALLSCERTATWL